MINLRPHHLICMKFYEGKGYSKDFVLNMNRVTGYLKNNPSAEIMLHSGCDDLCSHCPHKTPDRTCESGQKVTKLDSDVLSSFKLGDGKAYSYGYLKELIDKNLTPEVFKNICYDCEWYKNGTCRLK